MVETWVELWLARLPPFMMVMYLNIQRRGDFFLIDLLSQVI